MCSLVTIAQFGREETGRVFLPSHDDPHKNRARGCREYTQNAGDQYFERGRALLPRHSISTAHPATAVGMLLFGGPGRGHQRLDETTHERRQGLERLLALLMSRVLARLCSSHLSQIIGHHPLELGGPPALLVPRDPHASPILQSAGAH